MVHFRSALTRHRATTLVGCILGAGALGPQPLGVQTDPCALLKAVDVSALFGAAATPNPSGRSCNWKAASGQRSLGVLVYSAEVPGEMMYTGARGKAGKQPGETVVDESGLGDKAFSGTASFGASFIMLKHGRVVQRQYLTRAPGTPKDRDELRVVARKAIAAF